MILTNLPEYDRWANAKAMEAIAELAEGEAREKCTKLMAHIFATQDVWLSRLQGEESTPEIWPDHTMDKLQEKLQASNRKLKAFLDATESSFSYHNSEGVSFDVSVEDLCVHLLSHGQHHRAQIYLLIRKAGHIPPATDYIYFTRERNN